MADLWIRTQNRNLLLKVDNINFCGTKIYTNNHDAAMSIDLGKYDTEQRVLEVFDEIQKLLLQPIAFLETTIPQGMSLKDVNRYIKHVNKFCGQNNLLYVGSKDCEIVPTNNTNIVFTIPED